MFRRDFGENASHERTQRPREQRDKSRAFGEPHDAEPQRHDADEREGNFDNGGVRHVQRRIRDFLELPVPAADEHRAQNESEPNVIQNGQTLQSPAAKCQSNQWVGAGGCSFCHCFSCATNCTI